MMLRTGKGGRYRCYTSGTAARAGKTGCRGRSVPMARDYVRAFAQHVVVGEKSATIMRTPVNQLAALSSVESAAFGVRRFVPEWRARQDSNL